MRAVRLSLPIAFAVAASAATAHALLTCGGTVGPSGVVVLTQDLDCRTDPNCAFPRRCTPALRITGSATLDMNGHSIHCASGVGDDGIALSGTGGTLRNGEVNLCNVGVRVAGGGQHTIRNVVSSRSRQNGFIVSSDRNLLEKSAAHTSGLNGFNLLGAMDNTLRENVATSTGQFNGFNVAGSSDRNRLTDNLAIANAGNGFNVSDDGNKLIRNVAMQNGNRGFSVNGASNAIKLNRASANSVGIDAGGTDNRIERNTAVGNEENDLGSGPGCDDVWNRNTFGRSDAPGCIR
jgi:hypothetical protein